MPPEIKEIIKKKDHKYLVGVRKDGIYCDTIEMYLCYIMLCLCVDRSIEHRSVLSAMRLAAELLSALAARSQYNGHVAHALSTLHMLQQRLQVGLIKI